MLTADVEETHRQLALKFGCELPRSNLARTPGMQSRFLRHIGYTWADLEECTGERRSDRFFAMNPDCTIREWAGIVLEGLDYQGVAPRPVVLNARQQRSAARKVVLN